MKKRSLITLICLGLAFLLLPAAALAQSNTPDLIVGGVEISQAGYYRTNTLGQVWPTQDSLWNVHYDGDGTLTLKNAHIQGPASENNGYAGIYANRSLTIELTAGTVNHISGAVSSDVANLQASHGIASSKENYQYDLSICGSGTLNITTSASMSPSMGVKHFKNLNISDGTVNIGSMYYGAYVMTVSVTGGVLRIITNHTAVFSPLGMRDNVDVLSVADYPGAYIVAQALDASELSTENTFAGFKTVDDFETWDERLNYLDKKHSISYQYLAAAFGPSSDNYPCLKVYDDYNVWVGGDLVNWDNHEDVLGDGKLSYDGNTLTLNNATITGSGTEVRFGAAIYTKRDLTLKLMGENNATAKPDATSIAVLAEGCDLTIKGDGRLTAIGTASEGGFSVGFGLCAEDGDISITGDASVDAAGSGSMTSGGIRTNESGDVTIATTGAVSATGNTGISAAGIITVSSGTVIAAGREKAMNIPPVTGPGARFTASTLLDGSSPVTYNSANIANYKYLRVTVPPCTVTLEMVADDLYLRVDNVARLGENDMIRVAHYGEDGMMLDTSLINNNDLTVTDGVGVTDIPLTDDTAMVKAFLIRADSFAPICAAAIWPETQ